MADVTIAASTYVVPAGSHKVPVSDASGSAKHHTLTSQITFFQNNLTIPADTDDIVEATSLYFTDERAQDAVGTILTDSPSVDFTYDDGAGTITAAVIMAGLTITESQISDLGTLTALVSDIGTSIQAWSAVLDGTTASFLVADETKLDGIEAGATADQTGAQIKAAYEGEADTNAFTDADESKLDGIEASADVTDTANVTAAGALMDSEVDADVKTLVLPANTTISAFGATLVDDAAASNARTTLDVDQAGTDNSDNNAVNTLYSGLVSNATHTGDVTGDTALTIAAGAVDIAMLSATGTPSGSTFLRGDNVWASPAGGGDMLAANNLSDLASAATSRTNLGVAIGSDVQAHSAVLDATTASFLTADETKLDGIETAADVTDATNVAAAGAMFDVLEDTTPQLGGDLDANGKNITDVHEIRVDTLPDTDHTANGFTTNSLNAGTTIAAFELVYLHTDGEWALTDADAAATAGSVMLGIALEAGTDTNPMDVALSGAFVRDDTWAWTVGAELYVSTTPGDLTETAPSATGDIVRVVGYAVTADVVYFLPGSSWVEIA